MSIEKYIEDNFNDMLSSISKIITIRTVKDTPKPDAPYGSAVKEGLEAVLKIAEELGFKTVNLDNYIGYAEHGEGEEYIAVLGHLDIVAEGQGWTFPPYKTTIYEGNFYGRGVLDNKSPIISCLYSLKALLSVQPDLNQKIRIIFGCNEESGTDDIEYYLSKESAPKYAFTPDGCFPVIYGEKGMFTFSINKKSTASFLVDQINAGTKSNIVPQEATVILNTAYLDRSIIRQFAEQTGYTIQTHSMNNQLHITCIGKSAHAAAPDEGKNAVVGLILLLQKIIKDDPFQEIIDFFFNQIGTDYYGETLGIAGDDSISGKLTCNLGLASYQDGEFYLKFNVRYPVNYKGDQLIKQLQNHFKNIEFNILSHNQPLYFSMDHPLIKILNNVYHNVTGRTEKPITIGGGTYAKLMPNTVAFGPYFPELISTAHQANEFIPLDTLKIGAVIYAYALKEMCDLK